MREPDGDYHPTSHSKGSRPLVETPDLIRLLFRANPELTGARWLSSFMA
jgi:hypothetical protein